MNVFSTRSHTTQNLLHICHRASLNQMNHHTLRYRWRLLLCVYFYSTVLSIDTLVRLKGHSNNGRRGYSRLIQPSSQHQSGAHKHKMSCQLPRHLIQEDGGGSFVRQRIIAESTGSVVRSRPIIWPDIQAILRGGPHSSSTQMMRIQSMEIQSSHVRGQNSAYSILLDQIVIMKTELDPQDEGKVFEKQRKCDFYSCRNHILSYLQFWIGIGAYPW